MTNKQIELLIQLNEEIQNDENFNDKMSDLLKMDLEEFILLNK